MQFMLSLLAPALLLLASGLTLQSSGHTTAGHVCSLRPHRRRRRVPLTSNVRPQEQPVSVLLKLLHRRLAQRSPCRATRSRIHRLGSSAPRRTANPGPHPTVLCTLAPAVPP